MLAGGEEIITKEEKRMTSLKNGSKKKNDPK